MVESEHSVCGWTLPGGGVDVHETLHSAAVREAWEEAGATVEIERELYSYPSWGGHTGYCFAATLVRLEPSPEARATQWIDPLSEAWCEDKQIKRILEGTDLFHPPAAQ
jgi:8-oxo-dGTP pyrophosphatase MutT (NUDIX family)